MTGRIVTSKRRAVYGIADQVVSSATNFLLIIACARESSALDFGRFSLLMTGYVFVLAIFRAVSVEPLLVLFPHGQGDTHDSESRRSVGAALVASAMCAVVVLATALCLQSADTLVYIFAGFLPVLVTQDALRYVLINRRRALSALVNDTGYLVLEIGGITYLALVGEANVQRFCTVWGLAGLVCCAVALYQTKLAPSVTRAGSWFRETRAYCGRYALEALAAQGGLQAVTYVLVGAAGVNASGSLRAAEALYKPAAVLTGGAKTALIPELSVRRQDPRSVQQGAVKLAFVLVALTAILGFPIVLLPTGVGVTVLGDSWQGARPLLIFVWLAQVGSVIAMSALIGLRALADAKRSFRAQLSALGLQTTLGILGVFTDGARGAVAGLAIASLIQATGWWLSLRASVRELGNSPARQAEIALGDSRDGSVLLDALPAAGLEQFRSITLPYPPADG